MIILTVILATLAISSANGKSLDTVTKAASPYTNCGCQCSSLTFLDSSSTVQGNCNTVDGTGAQWCYVDSSLSSCQDLVPSSRFPHNPWSYEACATPPIGSLACPSYSPPSHPHPAVPTAEQGTASFPIGPPIYHGSHPRGPPAFEAGHSQGPPVTQSGSPQGPPFVQNGLPQGPPVALGGLPLGPPNANNGLPLGPPVIEGGLPLGPADVDTFPEEDEPQTPEDNIDIADERGIFGRQVAPSK